MNSKFTLLNNFINPANSPLTGINCFLCTSGLKPAICYNKYKCIKYFPIPFIKRTIDKNVFIIHNEANNPAANGGDSGAEILTRLTTTRNGFITKTIYLLHYTVL